jgi:hypothetical protein
VATFPKVPLVTDRFGRHYEVTALGREPEFAAAERVELGDEATAAQFTRSLRVDRFEWPSLMRAADVEIDDLHRSQNLALAVPRLAARRRVQFYRLPDPEDAPAYEDDEGARYCFLAGPGALPSSLGVTLEELENDQEAAELVSSLSLSEEDLYELLGYAGEDNIPGDPAKYLLACLADESILAYRLQTFAPLKPKPKPPPKPPPKPGPKPGPEPDKKLLEVKWNKAEAWCSEDVALEGTARNFDPDTQGSATLEAAGKGAVGNLKAKGQNAYLLPWTVKDLDFKGDSMPDKYEVKGSLTALGQTVHTPAPLVVKRVPDKPPEAVTFARTSGVYAWTAAFKVGVAKDKLKIEQKLQIKKAWVGRWVKFDSTKDGISGWSWVKQSGAKWLYWNRDASPAAKWDDLPRAITKYTVKNVFFIKSGSDFVSRDDASMKWPESFPEPTNYAAKKKAWLDNIHSVWDDKFDLTHKACKSASGKICKWRIRVAVEWIDTAGDKLVYAVWAQFKGRSNASDWYLNEDRVSVAAHECGHLLGAYDEYLPDGANDPATNKIDEDSIMGQNLTNGKPRHLDGLRDQAKTKINGWTGQSWDFEVKDA